MGNALEKNTKLRSLKIYLNLGNNSPLHLVKFLGNPQSQLEHLSFIKITKHIFDHFAKFLNKKSKLKESN